MHSLRVELANAPTPGHWILRYALDAEPAALRLPAVVPAPGPADGLWRHTCLEAFVGAADTGDYREFNFSPSGQWAAYAFRAPRERAGAGHVQPAPRMRWTRSKAALRLEAWLPWDALPPRAARAHALGLCAVIEDRSGRLSYWALAHPSARPDFHDRGGWTACLPPSTHAT